MHGKWDYAVAASRFSQGLWGKASRTMGDRLLRLEGHDYIPILYGGKLMNRTSIWFSSALAAAILVAGPTAMAGQHEQAGMSGQGDKSRAEIAALEVQTAAKHAGLAAQAQDAEGAHTHLQHALNCLVGKDDPAYDASAEDPCKGEGGQGAIADAGQASGDQKAENSLKQAKEVAMQGKQQGGDDATAAAKRVQSLLQDAEDALQKGGGGQ